MATIKLFIGGSLKPLQDEIASTTTAIMTQNLRLIQIYRKYTEFSTIHKNRPEDIKRFLKSELVKEIQFVQEALEEIKKLPVHTKVYEIRSLLNHSMNHVKEVQKHIDDLQKFITPAEDVSFKFGLKEVHRADNDPIFQDPLLRRDPAASRQGWKSYTF